MKQRKVKPVVSDRMTEDLIRMCARQKWDGCLAITSQGQVSCQNLDEHFYKWIAEIERQNGGESLGWVRFSRREQSESASMFYILINGLSACDTAELGKRWSAISGDPRSRCRKFHTSQLGGQRLTRWLRTLLDEEGFRNCNVMLRFDVSATSTEKPATQKSK